MNNSNLSSHVRYLAVISAISLFVSGSLFSSTANSATSGTETVEFTIIGGDMGGGDSCIPIDYTLTTSLGGDVADPEVNTFWTSEDINIVQTSGLDCDSNSTVSAQSLNIVASDFSNSLEAAPNILCDEVDQSNYTGAGTTASCSSATAKVNINVFVPGTATPGLVYSSVVTITAVL